ncbi:MAG TPA: phosphohistidine phosphatase SixA [Bryobacteraceae bacterium]|nr:phosphohistidine phosphatase SixA [Bryobacteraceae bacterium]
MQLYLLRHGIAEEGSLGGNDSDRTLTGEGRKKLRDVLKAAQNARVAPELIVSSPYVRAIQTAEVAAVALAYKGSLLRTDALIPMSDAQAVWEEIRIHKAVGQLLLVGHEPLLSRCVGFLLAAPDLFVDMKKGALVRIDVDQFGANPRGVLKWMITPKLTGV